MNNLPPFQNKQNSQNSFFSETFSNLVFTEQTLHAVEFENCTFENCDFSGNQFLQCRFSECHFIKCQLSMIEVTNSQFSDVAFNECKMLAIDWTKADWQGLSLGMALQFSHCNCSSSSFYGLNQRKAVFGDCKLHDIDFREADFSQASFAQCDLLHSLFLNTNLTEANFDGAINYNINVLNNTVSNATFNRLEAVSLLESLGVCLID